MDLESIGSQPTLLADPKNRLHQTLHIPKPVEEFTPARLYNYRVLERLVFLMEHRIPCEVIPHLEDYPATWHPSGFMVYRLKDGAEEDLGALRLHIWPAGLRQREHRGYGGMDDDDIWDGDIHNHAWHVNSYNITGYRDQLYDVITEGRDVSEEEITRYGLFRKFEVSYLDSGEDALVASGEIVRVELRELRDGIFDTDIHEVEVGDFHAPCIPRHQLAATLALNSHRLPELEGPDILVRGTAAPIIGARRPVTREEALEAKAQLLAVPGIRRKQPVVVGTRGMQTLKLTDLPIDVQADVAWAERVAHERAYPPSKATKFGTVIVADGKRYVGTNHTRWAWNDTTCSERMALDQVFSNGGPNTKIERVVIYGTSVGGRPMSPCGSCRELLKEAAHRQGQKMEDIPVIMVGSNKACAIRTSLSDLLPLSDTLTVSESWSGRQKDILIGLTGPTGAGKDTAAEYLAQLLGASHVSGSDIVKSMLSKVGGDVTKEATREFSQRLRKYSSSIVVEQAIAQAINGQGIIVSGFRSPAEAREIKRRGGSLVYIDADSSIRHQRVASRQRMGDPLSPEQLSELDTKEQSASHEQSGDEDLEVIKAIADFVLLNEGSLDELRRKISNITPILLR